MITLTESARQKVGEFVAEAGTDCRGVRIRAARVGSHTFRYQIHLVREADTEENDTRLPFAGFTVYIDLQTAQWYGISALAAYKLTQRLEGIFRADYIVNNKNGGGLLGWSAPDAINGIGPAFGGAYDVNGDPDYTNAAAWEKGADKYAITAGLAYAVNANTTFKLEYRFDGVSQKAFGNKDVISGAGVDPKYLNNNSLVSTALVVFF
jgi:Fe-S cluster assembly iron-binding protein IscA